ncbi:phosphoglycerate kinase [Puccinia graminis f. sp. tritici]|uniref:Phosphoglycerate kinase n=1 Tax=Puccinia graminis f. sp. tritici TaxID=56615 RepID=A0A5B0RZT8_PUCGR|nr:phosphoglycerate kinase [Puccinia graminis f. sp. tritici]
MSATIPPGSPSGDILQPICADQVPLSQSQTFGQQQKPKTQGNRTNKPRLSSKKTITDLPAGEIKGKRVLIRVDFNVPQDKTSGQITNNARIVAALPTIKYVIENGSKAVILCSHLGRPNGAPNAKYTLRPVAEELQKVLGKDVTFIDECVGPKVEETVAGCKEGQVFLLENLRFHLEEEGSKKDEETGEKTKASAEAVEGFRASLTKLADLYINDAFGTAHRAHSSVVGFKGEPRLAGFLMKKELEFFSKVLEKPEPPFLAILGGAKISDKIQLIENLLDKVNKLIVCGGMAFTFKKMLDSVEIGNSLFDEDGSKKVHDLVAKAKKNNVELIFPIDYICGDKFAKDAARKTVTDAEGVPKGWMGLDAGPASREEFKKAILSSKTILWNGPAGVFEFDNFAEGSKAMLDACIEACQKGATVIVGGGDTATVCKSSTGPQFRSSVL